MKVFKSVIEEKVGSEGGRCVDHVDCGFYGYCADAPIRIPEDGLDLTFIFKVIPPPSHIIMDS